MAIDFTILSDAIKNLETSYLSEAQIEEAYSALQSIASVLIGQGYASKFKDKAPDLGMVIRHVSSIRDGNNYDELSRNILNLSELSDSLHYDDYLSDDDIEGAEESRVFIFNFFTTWISHEQQNSSPEI